MGRSRRADASVESSSIQQLVRMEEEEEEEEEETKTLFPVFRAAAAAVDYYR